MTNIITRAIIGFNFLFAFVLSLIIFGHNGGKLEVSLALLVSAVWVALAATLALKCTKTRGWVGLLLAMITAPTGLVLAYVVMLLRPISWR